jgi:hypothetical protein
MTAFFSFLTQRRIEASTFIFVCLLGAGLRLITFDRYLPYADYTDETVYLAYGREMRGLGNQDSLRETYGEAISRNFYNYLNRVIQDLYDTIKPHKWDIIWEQYYVLRLVSVLMGIMTTVLIGLTAYRLSGWWAAILAALVWAMSPYVLLINNLAIPDPLLYLALALSIWAGFEALQRLSYGWLFVSLVGGILAVFAKTWTVMGVGPFVVILAYFLWKRHFSIRWLLASLVLAGVSGAYFVFGLRPVDSLGVAYNTESDFLVNQFFNLARHTNNFYHAILPIGLVLFWSVLGLGMLTMIYNWRKKATTFTPLQFVLLLGYIIFSLLLTSIISNVTADNRMRHIFPAGMAIFILWGVWVAQIGIAVAQFRSHWKLASGLIPLLIGAAWGVMQAPSIVQYVRELERTHINVLVWNWEETSLPLDGGWIVTPAPNALDNIFNPLWGGYNGSKQFYWYFTTPEDLITRTPEQYAYDNFDYVFLNDDAFNRQGFNGPEVQALLEQMLLIKTFPVDAQTTAGTTTYVYAISQPQHRTEIDFGDVFTLMGYNLSNEAPNAGDTITLRNYWRIEQPITTNYNQFVHLYAVDGTDILAQADGTPQHPNRLTSQWTDLDEVYIGADFNIILPPDLPEEEYRLVVGLYNWETGQRLSTSEGDSYTINLTVSR